MSVPSFLRPVSHPPVTDQMRLSTLSEGIFLFQVFPEKLIRTRVVIDRPYSLGCATVGALYERPRCIFCAKPLAELKPLVCDNHVFHTICTAYNINVCAVPLPHHVAILR